MTCERARDQIHELIDGTLGPIRVAELTQHLEQCPSCRALAEDLRRLREVTATLEPLEPPAHVWMQIAGRLRQEGRVRVQQAPQPKPAGGFQYTWMAIAATLLLAVGGSLFVLYPRIGQNPASQTTVARQGNAPGNDAVQSGMEDLRQAEQIMQRGIASLKEGLGSDQQALSAETVQTLEQNLQILDQAINESSSALKQDPQNVAARNSLFDALQRKISVLQDTMTLLNEMRKGSAAGAAASEGMNKS
jgi:anti-sigma factor RsiW